MFEITVTKIVPREDAREGYSRTESIEIYSQKVEVLDLKAVISAVNYEPAPPVKIVTGINPDEVPF